MVDFGAGEPDFPTPENIKRAAIHAIERTSPSTRPPPAPSNSSRPSASATPQDFGTDYTPNECIVTVGGKHAIFNLIQALLNPGDEVIIPVPYWVTYKDVVNYAGGKCVFVETDETDGFELTAAMIERHSPPRPS